MEVTYDEAYDLREGKDASWRAKRAAREKGNSAMEGRNTRDAHLTPVQTGWALPALLNTSHPPTDPPEEEEESDLINQEVPMIPPRAPHALAVAMMETMSTALLRLAARENVGREDKVWVVHRVNTWEGWEDEGWEGMVERVETALWGIEVTEGRRKRPVGSWREEEEGWRRGE